MIPPLEILKHGKLLCQKVYPLFVDTFNWVTRALANLRGDYDLNQLEGHVSVDWKDPTHPVVRLKNLKRLSDTIRREMLCGCFEICAIGIVGTENQELDVTMCNLFWRRSGVLHKLNADNVTVRVGGENRLIYLLVHETRESDGGFLPPEVAVGRLDDVVDNKRTDVTFVPLYLFGRAASEANGGGDGIGLLVDFRLGVVDVTWEVTV